MRFLISDQYQPWPYLALFSHNTTTVYRTRSIYCDTTTVSRDPRTNGRTTDVSCMPETRPTAARQK